ncbi:uncharacterized protein LOC111711423 isoform X2 [Eurytemora carolleeae]|uniref:uncharacterized protein LOC111711423 isoform X2 n=1 Tax=Eurytemora carolleeae TaxID=1294199 RepID=UPI000C774662|nr:uncharacterized protein LOC111711423 isoform X2 [Eurytemora carolleeae]|eukprot:XP_023341556.1 uncharacterized protein LOC111711423 isoform X2 [Eurytemora affinis]
MNIRHRMNKEEITKHLKEVHKKQETETAESGYFSESTCQDSVCSDPTEERTWMVKLHEFEDQTPQLFPKTEDLTSKCINHPRGCKKTGTLNKLIFHQHVCRFPMFTSSYKYNQDFVRTFRCQGFICTVFSDLDNFVSFNNSFIKLLNIQFFFKLHNFKELHIQGFCLNDRYKSANFKFKCKSGHKRKSAAGQLNNGTLKIKFPEKIPEKSILKYTIHIEVHDPPITI